MAADSQGAACAELAQRGFNVLSVGSSALSLAQAGPSFGGQLEPSVVRDGAADLVTCMDSLEWANPIKTLTQAHRMLKPGGKLVVAFNDRDLRHGFVDIIEEVIETHVSSYSRHAAQHTPQTWAPALRQGGLFKLVEYGVHPNPVALLSVDSLGRILTGQPHVAGAASRLGRKELRADIRSLCEWGFGQEGPVELPMHTRLYVLQRVMPRILQ